MSPSPGLPGKSYEEQYFTRELPGNLENLVEADVDEGQN